MLSDFKVEEEAYADLKKKPEPKVSLINGQDNDRKVIKWSPIFMDCLSRTHDTKGHLVYILRENQEVPDEGEDPLQPNTYVGESGCLHDELIKRLPHTGPIYKHDNATVFLKIEKVSRGTSVESTVKAFDR